MKRESKKYWKGWENR